MRLFISLCIIIISLNAKNIVIENAINRVISSWNIAMNNRDLATLYNLYAPQVIYYGRKMSKDLCIEDKKRFYRKHPYFHQYISNIKYVVITNRLYKLIFNKYVLLDSNRASKLYPSYLVIDFSDILNGHIIEEGDNITDRNIQKNSIQTFSFEGIHQIRGIVKSVQFYGPPGFGEFPGDKPSTAYIIKLYKPIMVINNTGDELNETTITDEIQLVLSPNLWKIIKAIKDKNIPVIVSGEFFSAHTAHHIRKLLIDVKSITFVAHRSRSGTCLN